MIGRWLKFGEGEPPADGEALVFVRYGAPSDALFEPGHGAEAVLAIHRNGVLQEQSGSSYAVPFGWYWTSLPAPSSR